VLSAKSRADALEQARTASAEAQGQQNYKTFSTRTGYQPGNVTMFAATEARRCWDGRKSSAPPRSSP
jgi:hypothetical protein